MGQVCRGPVLPSRVTSGPLPSWLTEGVTEPLRRRGCVCARWGLARSGTWPLASSLCPRQLEVGVKVERKGQERWPLAWGQSSAFPEGIAGYQRWQWGVYVHRG